jgi:tetratricopeptide (TPR) repeat protein
VARSRVAGGDRARWAWPALLAIAAAVLYSNALENPFVLDDARLISQNPTVNSPSFAGLCGLWVTDYWTGIDSGGRTRRLSEDRNLYRPVTVLSLWLNAAVLGGEVEPARFRWVNVVLHAGAAWLVGLWCASWLGRRAGFVASGLFVLHLVATDVVNRIVGRADLLAVLGVVGFLVVQSRALRMGGWTWGRAIVAAVAVAIALGSKEVGVVVVPMAVLQEWLYRRQHAALSRGRLGWLAVCAPVLFYAAARLAVIGVPDYETERGWELLQNPATTAGFAERLPAAFDLAWTYARLSIFPWPLVAFDLPARLPLWSDLTPWLGAGVLAVLGFAAVRWTLLGEAPGVLGAALWLLAFGVVSQLVAPIGVYSEVRLAYPMLPGVALLGAWGASRLQVRRAGARFAAAAALAAIALAAVVGIRARNAEFGSEMALLEADLRHRPGSTGAMLRLGTVYRSIQRWDDSQRLLSEVTRRAPESSQAWFEVALLSASRGDTPAARSAYLRVLSLDPRHTGALMNLGVLEMNAGDLAAAAGYFDTATKLSPDGLLLKYNSALLDARLGRLDAAKAKLREVLAAQPDLIRVEQVLGYLEQHGALPKPEEALGVVGM